MSANKRHSGTSLLKRLVAGTNLLKCLGTGARLCANVFAVGFCAYVPDMILPVAFGYIAVGVASTAFEASASDFENF
jgi:hypothetical protein